MRRISQGIDVIRHAPFLLLAPCGVLLLLFLLRLLQRQDALALPALQNLVHVAQVHFARLIHAPLIGFPDEIGGKSATPAPSV